MRPSPRFRIEIASIHRGKIFFNVYDSMYEGRVAGFAMYDSENEVVFTNIKTNVVNLGELNHLVIETGRQIQSCF